VIKTYHGSFETAIDKYLIEGQSSTYLQQIGEFDGEGSLLKDFSLTYLSKLSYRETIKLVKQVTTLSFSTTRLKNLLSEKNTEIELEQALLIDNQMIDSNIEVVAVDIYEETNSEVLFMKDGVCAKKQKAKRDKVAKDKKERTFTDVMSLELPNGEYETIVAAGEVDANALCKATVKYHYTPQIETRQKLPIVVISDGATSIKNDAVCIFGTNVSHILDWYHLDKKVKQYLSMIAPNKKSKQQDYEQIVNYLWEGQDDKAIKYLEKMASRNDKKREDLVKYLRKNQPYMICYKYRQQIGKTIGSGRVEKMNDIIVAKRQKNNSMAWSPTGSTELAVLTAYLHNQNISSTN